MAKKSKDTISITLNNQEIPVERLMMRQRDLHFYPKNPRIYSLVWNNGIEPSQETIQEVFEEMDHVKELVQSIRANGGVLDPLLVRRGDNVVLEGNSRLAALRILEKENAIRWGEAKCDIIPKNISDEAVFSLLTQYHIVGRKDWEPFERAGIFWRRYKEGGISKNEIAEEATNLGLSSRKVKHMIEVYDFMVEHKDASPSRWSYYDEYLKSRFIQQVRNNYRKFDKVIVQKIRSGEIERADDIRKKVHKIAKIGGKTLNKFIENKGTLEDCYERAILRGADNLLYQRMQRFRKIIVDPDCRNELQGMPENQKNKCIFELKKIRNATEKWLILLG